MATRDRNWRETEAGMIRRWHQYREKREAHAKTIWRSLFFPPLQASNRRLCRLFAAACYRHPAVWPGLSDVSRAAAEIAERLATMPAADYYNLSLPATHRNSRNLDVAPASHFPYYAAVHAARYTEAIFPSDGPRELTLLIQIARPEWRIRPEWLTGNVRSLAAAIYDQNNFSTLPILADALEEAGCDDHRILNYARTTDYAFRGEWLIDTLTGRR